MTLQQAQLQIDAAYRCGDIDAETWLAERDALERAHEQAQSAQDEQREITE